MKDFISILISFLVMSIADSIDTSFNNLISVDAIVVWGSFLLIDLIFRSITEIGTYTYRITRKNEWSYLWFNILFGLLMGIIVLISKNVIIDIFNITEVQKNMLSILLNVYIGYLVLGRLANGIFEIIRLKGNLKLYRKSLIIYYVVLISLDVITYYSTRNLLLLVVATMVSWIVSIIYTLCNLKLKFELPNKETLNNVITYGFPYSAERLLSRIFLLLYGKLASNLGTEKYSVHTICYSVYLSLEILPNAYQAMLMINVPKKKTYKDQYKKCMELKNKCFLLIVGLNFVFSFIYLFIYHGSLPLSKCLPYILFYSVAVFGLYPYETYKTLCITQGKSTILLIGSIIGVILRFIFCLLFINTPVALVVFGLANCIDFGTRSIIYKIVLQRLEKKKVIF